MPDGSAEGKIIITMSLDIYIYSHRPVRHQGTGVFIRDNGQTRELKTIDEVRQHFPDADLSDIRAPYGKGAAYAGVVMRLAA